MIEASDYSMTPTGATPPPAPRPSHTVSAVYPSREEADGVRQTLMDRGIAAGYIRIFRDAPPLPTEEVSDDVLKDVLVDGSIGTAVGTGVGALGTLAIMAAGVTVFVASPVVAPLAMLGWFAGIGGIVGAAVGAGRKEGRFSELVADAIQAGNTVLLVRTHDEAEQALARGIVKAS